MKFTAQIIDRDGPIQLTTTGVMFDDIPVFDSSASFDYASHDVTTVITTRSGEVMELVDVSNFAIEQTAGMFLRATSLGNGEVQFELVANAGVSTGAVGFTLNEESLGNFELVALKNWSAQVNQSVSGVISVAAIASADGSQNLSAGTEFVLARFTASGEIGLSVTNGTLGTVDQVDMVANVSSQLSSYAGEVVQTIEDGAYLHVYADADFTNVSPTRAITAQDALEALRLSVGMKTTGGQSDAFTFISADFNQNGRVTAQDALDILRFVVNSPDALQADWAFVNTDGDYSAVTKSNVIYEEGVTIDSLLGDTAVNLTGILRGDVNDSFSTLLIG